MTKRILALTAILLLLLPSVVLAASGSTRFPQFAKQRARGIELVPSSATDVTSTNSTVFQLSVSNKTGSPVTLTLLDKQGTPRNIIPTVSIAANTLFIAAWPEGLYAIGGLTWSASSANALEAEIVVAYQ